MPTHHFFHTLVLLFCIGFFLEVLNNVAESNITNVLAEYSLTFCEVYGINHLKQVGKNNNSIIINMNVSYNKTIEVMYIYLYFQWQLMLNSYIYSLL
jgi:hypothetical protein